MNLFSAPTILKEMADTWDKDIIPELMRYIKIPNQSPQFDPHWKSNGYMDEAMQLIAAWCRKQPLRDMKLEVIQKEERTPLLLIEIPGSLEETVLLYGHMDKQPEMKGWENGLGPWKPVLRDHRLYGRGGADDGYAVFAALTAIAALQRHRIPHARIIVLIEASEESGSIDLPFYLRQCRQQIGSPNLVICLDSGCANYDQLWGTTSLRGLVDGKLTIAVLKEGLHSGVGSGVVPSPVTILRQLLDRLENSHTGEVLLKEAIVTIPPFYLQAAREMAQAVDAAFYSEYPFLSGVQPITPNTAELLLNKTWRPQLSVTGIDGLPASQAAGNVTIPDISVTLSLRLPPTCAAEKASLALKALLEKDPPFGAKVSFTPRSAGPGWKAPEQSPWLAEAIEQASQQFYGKPAAYMGEGGSIPFMGMLGKMFPKAQFFITGVLGPRANAHGPNEFLHIPMVKKLTGCISSLLCAHGTTNRHL